MPSKTASCTVSSRNLRLLCDYQPQTRYATPNGCGYMALAFVAAHRRTRRAVEAAGATGFGLFFYNEQLDDTDNVNGGSGSPPAGQAAPSDESAPSCRGFLFVREEKESIQEVRAMRIPAHRDGLYLTITCAPPTLLEEYLPLLKWWLPARYHAVEEGEQQTAAAPAQSSSGGGGDLHAATTRPVARRRAMGVQLFLRDATNAAQGDAKKGGRSGSAAEQQQQQQPDDETVRRRTYDALAVYNAVCLLTALPVSRDGFAGLECLKLVNFPMSPLLWDAVVVAGRSAKVLNLSCCTAFTDAIALEAMREKMPKPRAGAGAGAVDGAGGQLHRLRALALPATDMTSETLRALVGATDPFYRLAYVNVGECAGLTDISALVAARASLRCLHAYALPRLEATLALEVVGRCGDHLRKVNLARCSSLVDVSALGRLRRVRQMDLQGCTALRSLAGLEGCVALRELWLTGCTALSFDTAQQRALFTHCRHLEDLQLGYVPGLLTAADGVLDLSALAAAAPAPALRVLSLAQCSSLKELRLPRQTSAEGIERPVVLPALTLLDIAGTHTTNTLLSALSEPVEDAAPATVAAPALHTLVMNACVDMRDFAVLKLPALLRLSLAGTLVNSAELDVLAVQCPRLQALNLDYCEEVSSFQPLKNFRAVRVLSVAHTRLTNTALQHILNVPFLQMLSMQDTAVTDLQRLAKAPYLRIVECLNSNGKVIKNTAQLRKAGVEVDETTPLPPLLPPMGYVS